MNDRINYFLSRINKLDTGQRATLRREAGNPIRSAAGKAITLFYSCLPMGVNPSEEDRWFAVACMRCLWDPGEEGDMPLEQLISKLLKSEELSESTKHRVENLLDTEWDADGYMLIKLVRLVKLVRSKSNCGKIDFSVLLKDIINWNADSQYVQRKWARRIFNENNLDDKEEF